MFTEIGGEALRLLAFSVETVSVRPGELLFEKGAPAEGAYVIVNGNIALKAGDGDRERSVGPGTLIGEMALIVPTERPCDAVALEPTRLIAIPRPLFRRVLTEFPEIAETIRQKLVTRVRGEQAALDRVRATLNALDQRD